MLRNNRIIDTDIKELVKYNKLKTDNTKNIVTENTKIKNRKIRQIWLNASFTAEASLLFPIILVIVFTVIYASFYLYDGVYIVSNAHIAAERSADGQIWNMEDSNDNEGEQKRYAREFLTKLSGGILFKASDVRIEKRFGRLKIQADLKRTGPAEVLRMTGLSADTGYETVKRRTDPAELTRISDILWNAGKSAADKLREAR